MKTSFIFIIIFSCFLSVYSQKTEQKQDFEEYVALFPERAYPFIQTYNFDADNSTPFTPPENIPIKMYIDYATKQDFLAKKDTICYMGLMAKGRFITNENYTLLLVAVDLEAGCGEENYLISYTPDGIIIDTLLTFGSGRLSPRNGERVTYKQDAEIGADSIQLKRREMFGETIYGQNGELNKNRIKWYNSVYHISPEGKFICTQYAEGKEEYHYWK